MRRVALSRGVRPGCFWEAVQSWDFNVEGTKFTKARKRRMEYEWADDKESLPLAGCLNYSWRTTVSKDLLTLILPLYSMKPSFLNLFMKKFTRERVVPIISARVSWETCGSERSG
jgi:hypothetical protein